MRDAIYRGDIDKVKSYFHFPIRDDDNRIWSLALTENKELAHSVPKDSIIMLFTEKDFDHYFKKLFTKEFITGILKIKSEDLFRKGTSSTAFFDRDPKLSYQMIASVDRKEKTLQLNLNFSGNDDSESDDPHEFAILYEFSIEGDGSLQFRRIAMAG